MNTSIVLSPRVINTLKALTAEDRKAIGAAIMDEIVLGESPTTLNPINGMLYAMISQYVRRDSHRYNAAANA